MGKFALMAQPYNRAALFASISLAVAAAMFSAPAVGAPETAKSYPYISGALALEVEDDWTVDSADQTADRYQAGSVPADTPFRLQGHSRFLCGPFRLQRMRPAKSMRLSQE